MGQAPFVISPGSVWLFFDSWAAASARVNRDEPIWLRLRQYVDGADSLSVVLSQLLDAALELEELA